jgi:hypothetical protein
MANEQPVKIRLRPTPSAGMCGATYRCVARYSISQEKLGNALGLPFQQVQKYENGYSSRRHQIAASCRCRCILFDGTPTRDDIVDATLPAHVADFPLPVHCN